MVKPRGPGPSLVMRVYEWHDELGRVAYVGWGIIDGPPWAHLWASRFIACTPVHLWLRTLGGVPRECKDHVPSGAVHAKEARAIVAARVRQLCAATWPEVPPGFLGRLPEPPGALRRVGRPVVQVASDGAVRGFPSIMMAATFLGVDWTTVEWWVRTGCPDRNGYTYFEWCKEKSSDLTGDFVRASSTACGRER
jgi:hypothetical protein